jgi:dTDP-4-amino-4,6-dideoxygalactose transaminase
VSVALAALQPGPPHADLPFHRPYVVGDEASAVDAVLRSGYTGGNGPFTAICERRLSELTGSPNVLLTHSCTGALELAALLAGVGPGD